MVLWRKHCRTSPEHPWVWEDKYYLNNFQVLCFVCHLTINFSKVFWIFHIFTHFRYSILNLNNIVQIYWYRRYINMYVLIFSESYRLWILKKIAHLSCFLIVTSTLLDCMVIYIYTNTCQIIMLTCHLFIC